MINSWIVLVVEQAAVQTQKLRLQLRFLVLLRRLWCYNFIPFHASITAFYSSPRSLVMWCGGSYPGSHEVRGRCTSTQWPGHWERERIRLNFLHFMTTAKSLDERKYRLSFSRVKRCCFPPQDMSVSRSVIRHFSCIRVITQHSCLSFMFSACPCQMFAETSCWRRDHAHVVPRINVEVWAGWKAGGKGLRAFLHRSGLSMFLFIFCQDSVEVLFSLHNEMMLNEMKEKMLEYLCT